MISTSLLTGFSSANEDEVRKILSEKCLTCHDVGKEAEYALNGSILNFDELIKQQVIRPGNPYASLLVKTIEAGLMPKKRFPGDTNTKLSQSEIDTISNWIASLKSQDSDEFTTEDQIMGKVFQDLAFLSTEEQIHSRYLYFYSNRDNTDNVLALKKLLNSLSWNPELIDPVKVLDDSNLLRIDLRSLGWTADVWNEILKNYPFLRVDARHSEFSLLTGTPFPLVRADWLIATAIKNPLYYKIIGMPSTESQLEKILGVTAASNIQNGNVVRAGFDNSGVSENQRVIERHSSKYGAYWKSYDFSDSLGKHNIFANPLSFDRSGGEIIFHLPNGMQGYLLIDAKGKRIDKAPVNIVRDNKRPDQQVENAISCVRCHSEGLINKQDQISAVLSKSKSPVDDQAFLDKVNQLYVPFDQFSKRVEFDNQKHQSALEAMGILVLIDPLTPAIETFERGVDLVQAAVEAGLKKEILISTIQDRKVLELFPLLNGQTVSRDIFNNIFIQRKLDTKVLTAEEKFILQNLKEQPIQPLINIEQELSVAQKTIVVKKEVPAPKPQIPFKQIGKIKWAKTKGSFKNCLSNNGQCQISRNGGYAGVSVDGKNIVDSDAVRACKGLGQAPGGGNWRLPSADEINASNLINQGFFKDKEIWSSTTAVGSLTNAHHFAGTLSVSDRDETYSVLCVSN